MASMTLGSVLLAVVGVALLMIVHESGHYLAARYFGMRVITFSIGFGPNLWSHKPEGSPTVFQVGIIPFLAYVRIDGMNPFEESEPDDKANYQNASLKARVVTVAAGSAFNYVFASLVLFIGLMIGGKRTYDEASMQLDVDPRGAAAEAGVLTGDKVLSVAGVPMTTWKDLPAEIGKHPGEAIELEIERDGAIVRIPVTPGTEGERRGKIMVRPLSKVTPVPIGEAAITSVKTPAKVVYALFATLAEVFVHRETPEVSGPVEIVKDVARAVDMGVADALDVLGKLSAYLAIFNLLPLPALDGGRLLFLVYEAVARRKANAKAEAMVHAAGLLMFLTLMVVVTVKGFF